MTPSLRMKIRHAGAELHGSALNCKSAHNGIDLTCFYSSAALPTNATHCAQARAHVP